MNDAQEEPIRFDLVKKVVDEIAAEQDEWLDDIYAGLLINGVKQHEIGVSRFPDGSLHVLVRGVLKYRHDPIDGPTP